MNFFNRGLGLRLGAVVSVLALSACDTSDDPVTLVTDPIPNIGEVRVIHASPDAPPVNVNLNGTAAITDLDFGESSGYARIDAGAYDIAVEGIIPGGNATVIDVAGFDVAVSSRNNILAVGDVAAIEPLVVDESAATPGAGEVAVAVVHAAPDAPAVDVFVTAPGADLTGLMPTATLAFKESADAGAVALGTVQIRAAVGGTVVFDSGDVDLTPFDGSKLLIAAIETTTATETAASPIKLLVATDSDAVTLRDAATTVGAKVIHVSPDAGSVAGGPVEVFATSDALGMDPVEIIDAFSYTDIVAGADTYVSIPSGDYIFDVAPNTNMIGDSVFTSAALTLGAGGDFTVIAAGRVAADPAFSLLATADDNRSIATEARVKVVHAAPAAGTVDVFVNPAGTVSVAEIEGGTAGTPLLDDFVFPTVTDYVSVAPGDYDIRVVAGGTVAINAEGFTLSPGLVANVIARGPLEPTGAPTDFGLIVTTN